MDRMRWTFLFYTRRKDFPAYSWIGTFPPGGCPLTSRSDNFRLAVFRLLPDRDISAQWFSAYSRIGTIPPGGFPLIPGLGQFPPGGFPLIPGLGQFPPGGFPLTSKSRQSPPGGFPLIPRLGQFCPVALHSPRHVNLPTRPNNHTIARLLLTNPSKPPAPFTMVVDTPEASRLLRIAFILFKALIVIGLPSRLFISFFVVVQVTKFLFVGRLTTDFFRISVGLFCVRLGLQTLSYLLQYFLLWICDLITFEKIGTACILPLLIWFVMRLRMRKPFVWPLYNKLDLHSACLP